jgi:antitoxin CptB
MNKLEMFKKKLVYRSSYRGTKEMDILLSGFVKKYINSFDEEELKLLDKFLDLEDEVISNYYYFGTINQDIDKNRISKKFKEYFI